MIQNLALAVIARLQNAFGEVKIQAAPYLSAPASPNLPTMAVYPGKFTIQETGRETPVTPQEKNVRQALKLQAGKAKSGPYPLDFVAMANSVKAMLTVPDSPSVLLEAQDFGVDYTESAISFPGKKTKAGDEVVVEYVSVQAVRRREFQQELFIDGYDADTSEAEKWVSLACAVILTGSDALLHEVNQRGGQRRKNFSAIPLSRQIQLVEGLPLFLQNTLGYRVVFKVLGELHLVQMFAESPSRIEEVVINQNF